MPYTVKFKSASDQGAFVGVIFETKKGDWRMSTTNKEILRVPPGTYLEIDASKGDFGWTFTTFTKKEGGGGFPKKGFVPNDNASIAGVIKSAIEAGCIKTPTEVGPWWSAVKTALEGAKSGPDPRATNVAGPANDDPFYNDPGYASFHNGQF